MSYIYTKNWLDKYGFVIYKSYQKAVKPLHKRHKILMKTFNLIKINIFKLLTWIFFIFICYMLVYIFIIILLDSIFPEFDGTALILMLLSIVFAFPIINFVVKKASSIIEVKLSKNEIIVDGENFKLSDIEKISTGNNNFLYFQKLKIRNKDGRKINLCIERFDENLHRLVYEVNKLTKSK